MPHKGKKKKGKKKIAKVMGEFKRGDLKSSSGQTVTKRTQAQAIAMNEAGVSRRSNRLRGNRTPVRQAS